MTERFEFFVTCPFGTENVAHADLAAIFNQFKPQNATNADGARTADQDKHSDANGCCCWFVMESVEHCWARHYGPPLPHAALKISVKTTEKEGQLDAVNSGSKRVGGGKEFQTRNAELRQRSNHEDGPQNLGRNQQSDASSNVRRNNDGASVAAPATKNTFLADDRIKSLGFEELIVGSGAKDCEADALSSSSSFRGTVSFAFNIPMDSPLVRTRRNTLQQTTTTTTIRQILLTDVYYLRSISGIFMHIAASSSSSTCDASQPKTMIAQYRPPPVAPYNPLVGVSQQTAMIGQLRNMFLVVGNNVSDKDQNLFLTRWDQMVEEINAIRKSVTTPESSSTSSFLADAHREMTMFDESEKEEEEEEKAIALFRVSAERFDKTQLEASGRQENKAGAKAPPTPPSQGPATAVVGDGKREKSKGGGGTSIKYAKLSSADIERFVGGLLGEHLCPEMEDNVFYDEEKGGKDTDDALSVSPLPLRPYRASMLYHHLDFTCLHDHDKMRFGLCIHDANPPKIDKEERPFADTTRVALQQRNSVRREVLAALKPSVVALRKAYRRRLAGEAKVADPLKSSSSIPPPMKQPPMARPGSFRHDLRWVKGDNSMNPCLASMLSWYLWGGRPEQGGKEGRCDMACSSSSSASSSSYVLVDPLGGTGTTILEAHLRSLMHGNLFDDGKCIDPSSSAGVFISYAGDLRLAEARGMQSNFEAKHLRHQILAMGLEGAETQLYQTRADHHPPQKDEKDPTISDDDDDDGASSRIAESFMATACHWDATALPFKGPSSSVSCSSSSSFHSSSVDGIISDLPFGRRCGNASVNDQLYVQLLCEFHRVLRKETTEDDDDEQQRLQGISSSSSSSSSSLCRPRRPIVGRCVLLTIERRLMITALVEAAVKGAPFRLAQRPFVVDMGGLMPYVFVLDKV